MTARSFPEQSSSSSKKKNINLSPDLKQAKDSSAEDDDYDGSLTGESEDEWAEERKAVRYIAESEMEDNLDLTSGDESDKVSSDFTAAPKSQSIRALIKARQNSQLSTTDPSNKSLVKSKASTSNILNRKDNLSESDNAVQKAYSSRKPIAHRSNKHAPIEVSSKKPITRKRTIVDVPKIERRDPRFDSLSGAVNKDLHEKSFGFLKEQRRAEIENLRQALNKAKKARQNPAQLEALEYQLRREENKEVQREKVEREKQALRKWKAEEREKRKEGKGAFYLKRKAQKEIVLTDRYQHLSQNKSKLHKSIERKRKKVDGKEKKSMPLKRSRQSD